VKGCRSYTVLCEDAQSACFIRRFLAKKSHINSRRDIYEKQAPSGQGCGEQWVRERFPQELEHARKHGTNLIVCLDADKETVRGRIRRLELECEKQKIVPRKKADSVAFILPKRNIETWLEYLITGGPVDEEHDYAGPSSHRADSNKCEPAARKLNALCTGLRGTPPQNPPVPFPDSLEKACIEAKLVGL